jgi:predicted DNA-binding transcriptional regulator YafY
MRYGKAEQLLELETEFRARHLGMTLDEIQERFGVGRRTAQRMRDAVSRRHPDLIEDFGPDRKKRWRLLPATNGLNDISYTADELADLEATIKLLRQQNMHARADSLESILAKVRATLAVPLAKRLDPDIEALVEAEGLAARPGPRPRIATSVLETLRDAVKRCQRVYIAHRKRQTGHATGRVVEPYGFLFGLRHYLVARDPKAKGGRIKLFSLGGITRASLDSSSFARDPAFSIQAFAKQSFGVFQEAPYDVVWRFPPHLAGAAREFLFHPDQERSEEPDGTLRVSFRAGGLLEMAWHLCMWGADVEVISPPQLRKLHGKLPKSWEATP